MQLVSVFDVTTIKLHAMTSMLTSTRLGLIACRYLAQAYYDQIRLTAPQLAAHYNMNVRSLMPALRGLTKVGILHSQIGGKTPGFILAKPPKEVSVYDIIVALEGKVKTPCCKEIIVGPTCDCSKSNQCKLRSLFDDIVDQSMLKLKNISVAEFATVNQ